MQPTTRYETLPARVGQLRLRDLMMLEHLATLGSLTETAARMHVTQSAITQALQSLEQAFGQALVLRGRRGQRGVQLTPHGAAALQHLRVARQELLAALSAAAEPQVLTLRLGALPLAMVSLLPDALARLRTRLPQVQVHLSETVVPELWRRLEAGELDAIVCRMPALNEQQALPSGVSLRTVGEENLVMVCARSHAMARKRKPRLEDLARQPWVLPPAGSFTRLAIDQVFLQRGIKGPVPAITSLNFHSNLRLAAEGSLLAVAPRSAVHALAKVLDLVIVPTDWGRQDSGIVLAWRESGASHPALQALLECF